MEVKSDSSFPVLGVTLGYIRSFSHFLASKGMKESTIKEVVEKLILPEIASTNGSFCDFLREKDQTTTGVATVFICHAWQNTFANLAKVVIDYFDLRRDSNPSEIIIWIDIFSWPLQVELCRSSYWWDQTYKNSILKFDLVLMVACSESDFTPLLEGKSLWAIYTTIQGRRRFEITIGNTFEEESNIEPDIRAENIINNLFAAVDCERIECYNNADKDDILKAIESTEEGCFGFNLFIANEMLCHLASKFEKEYEHRKSLHGGENNLTLLSLCSLSTLLRFCKDYEKAESLMYESLEITSIRGNSVGLKNLLAYYDENIFKAAETWFRDCYERRKELLGENDLNTLRTMNKLAAIYVSKNEYVKAEALAEECLQRLQVSFKPSPIDLLQSFERLFQLYKNQDKILFAECFLLECFINRKKLLGMNHHSTLSTMINLAELYEQQENYELMRDLLRSFIENSKSICGPVHPTMIRSKKMSATVKSMIHSSRSQKRTPHRNNPLHFAAMGNDSRTILEISRKASSKIFLAASNMAGYTPLEVFWYRYVFQLRILIPTEDELLQDARTVFSAESRLYKSIFDFYYFYKTQLSNIGNGYYRLISSPLIHHFEATFFSKHPAQLDHNSDPNLYFQKDRMTKSLLEMEMVKSFLIKIIFMHLYQQPHQSFAAWTFLLDQLFIDFRVVQKVLRSLIDKDARSIAARGNPRKDAEVFIVLSSLMNDEVKEVIYANRASRSRENQFMKVFQNRTSAERLLPQLNRADDKTEEEPFTATSSNMPTYRAREVFAFQYTEDKLRDLPENLIPDLRRNDFKVTSYFTATQEELKVGEINSPVSFPHSGMFHNPKFAESKIGSTEEFTALSAVADAFSHCERHNSLLNLLGTIQHFRNRFWQFYTLNSKEDYEHLLPNILGARGKTVVCNHQTRVQVRIESYTSFTAQIAQMIFQLQETTKSQYTDEERKELVLSFLYLHIHNIYMEHLLSWCFMEINLFDDPQCRQQKQDNTTFSKLHPENYEHCQLEDFDLPVFLPSDNLQYQLHLLEICSAYMHWLILIDCFQKPTTWLKVVKHFPEESHITEAEESLLLSYIQDQIDGKHSDPSNFEEVCVVSSETLKDNRNIYNLESRRIQYSDLLTSQRNKMKDIEELELFLNELREILANGAGIRIFLSHAAHKDSFITVGERNVLATAKSYDDLFTWWLFEFLEKAGFTVIFDPKRQEIEKSFDLNGNVVVISVCTNRYFGLSSIATSSVAREVDQIEKKLEENNLPLFIPILVHFDNPHFPKSCLVPSGLQAYSQTRINARGTNRLKSVVWFILAELYQVLSPRLNSEQKMAYVNVLIHLRDLPKPVNSVSSVKAIAKPSRQDSVLADLAKAINSEIPGFSSLACHPFHAIATSRSATLQPIESKSFQTPWKSLKMVLKGNNSQESSCDELLSQVCDVVFYRSIANGSNAHLVRNWFNMEPTIFSSLPKPGDFGDDVKVACQAFGVHFFRFSFLLRLDDDMMYDPPAINHLKMILSTLFELVLCTNPITDTITSFQSQLQRNRIILADESLDDSRRITKREVCEQFMQEIADEAVLDSNFAFRMFQFLSTNYLPEDINLQQNTYCLWKSLGQEYLDYFFARRQLSQRMIIPNDANTLHYWKFANRLGCQPSLKQWHEFIDQILLCRDENQCEEDEKILVGFMSELKVNMKTVMHDKDMRNEMIVEKIANYIVQHQQVVSAVRQKTLEQLLRTCPEIKWHVMLMTLTPRECSGTMSGRQMMSLSGSRFLTHKVYIQLFEPSQNTFSPRKSNHSKSGFKEENGRHLVGYVQNLLNKKALCFKLQPEFPMIEQAGLELMYGLFGYPGIPFSEMMRMNRKGSSLFLVSAYVEGIRADEVFSNADHADMINKLDEQRVGELIIYSILSNPEDGRLQNYIFTQSDRDASLYKIVAIDIDHSFAAAIPQKLPGWFSKETKTSSMLFTLPLMSEPIAESIQERLRKLDVDELFVGWLDDLERLEHEYRKLYNENEEERAEYETTTTLTLPMNYARLMHVYWKLKELKSFVLDYERTVEAPQPTYMEALKRVEKYTGDRYEAVNESTLSIGERFKKSDGRLSSSMIRGDFRDYALRFHEKKGSGSTALDTIAQVRETLRQKKQQHQRDIEEFEKMKEEFRRLSAAEQEELFVSYQLRIATTKEEEATRTRGGRGKAFDDAEIERKWLDLVSECVCEWQRLIIRHNGVLRKSWFVDAPKTAFYNLTLLELHDCSEVTGEVLDILSSQKSCRLEGVILSSLENLRTLCARGVLGRQTSNLLEFPDLRSIRFINNINLKRIHINSPKLRHLVIEGCSHIEWLSFGDISHLKSLQCDDKILQDNESIKKFDATNVEMPQISSCLQYVCDLETLKNRINDYRKLSHLLHNFLNYRPTELLMTEYSRVSLIIKECARVEKSIRLIEHYMNLVDLHDQFLMINPPLSTEKILTLTYNYIITLFKIPNPNTERIRKEIDNYQKLLELKASFYTIDPPKTEILGKPFNHLYSMIQVENDSVILNNCINDYKTFLGLYDLFINMSHPALLSNKSSEIFSLLNDDNPDLLLLTERINNYKNLVDLHDRFLTIAPPTTEILQTIYNNIITLFQANNAPNNIEMIKNEIDDYPRMEALYLRFLKDEDEWGQQYRISSVKNSFDYYRFINGKLVFRPPTDQDMDIYNVIIVKEFSFHQFARNNLEGEFDLSDLIGRTGGNICDELSIHIGYRKKRISSSTSTSTSTSLSTSPPSSPSSCHYGKTEVWIVPKFLIERDLVASSSSSSSSSSSRRIEEHYYEESSSLVEIFFTNGDCDYYTNQQLDQIKNKPLHHFLPDTDTTLSLRTASLLLSYFSFVF